MPVLNIIMIDYGYLANDLGLEFTGKENTYPIKK